MITISIHSAAAATEWSPAIRLTPPGTTGWFPTIATDIAGGVHAFWSFGEGDPVGTDHVMYCRVGGDGCETTMSVVARTSHDGRYVTRPAAAVDDDGTMHLVWRRKFAICYTRAALDALEAPNWERLHKLGEGTYTALVLDSRGRLHAAWTQPVFTDPNGPCHGCGDIYYSRSDDHGRVWSLPVNVSKTLHGSEKPHIAVANDGVIYIAWEEGRDQYVGRGRPLGSMVSASRDGGRTWLAPTAFTYPDDSPHSIAIGIDARNRVVVAWQQLNGDNVFFQTSENGGQSWSVAAPIPGVRRRTLANKLDDYDMAADGAGHLHLVLTGGLIAEQPPLEDDTDVNSAAQHVLHVEWDGAAWSDPHVLFTTDGAPEWPRIAIGNGNRLHVVWFERPAGYEWDTSANNYVVWYARGTSTAASIAPVAWKRPPRPLLTGQQWFALVQLLLGLTTVASVIVVARRRGW